MNSAINHLINTRTYTTYESIEAELNLDKTKNYLFDLSFLAILDVSGEKAIDFLQGQLTCDVKKITDIQMIQGAQCNLKGRILALMDIIDWCGVKLIVPEDLLDVSNSSLTKTALLSRVSIQENKSLKIYGFYLQDSQDLLPDTSFFPNNLYGCSQSSNYYYYHLGNGFYIFMIDPGYEEQLRDLFINKKQFLGSLTWHTLRLRHRQIEIYPESRGLFLPHRIDLHKTEYISFNKGCYKGQEIVARTHYRATIKHELKIYKIKKEQSITSGQKLINPTEGTEFGEIIDYSLLNDEYYLIAASVLKDQIKLATLEGTKAVVHLLDE